MADLTRGLTFSVGPSYQPADVHSFLEDGTVTNINRADAEFATTSFITKSSTAPVSPTTNEFWFDTTLLILRRWTGTLWVAYGLAEHRVCTVAVVAGDTVIVDTVTAGQVTTSLLAADKGKVFGVALEAVSAGASGLFMRNGMTSVVNVTAATAIGNGLNLSTATLGKADPVVLNATNASSGVFGIAMSSTAGAGSVVALVGQARATLGTDVANALGFASTPSTTVPFLTRAGLLMTVYDISTTGTTPVGTGALSKHPIFAILVGVVSIGAASGTMYVGFATGLDPLGGAVGISVGSAAAAGPGGRAEIDADSMGGSVTSATNGVGIGFTGGELNVTKFTKTDGVELTPSAAGGTWTGKLMLFMAD